MAIASSKTPGTERVPPRTASKKERRHQLIQATIDSIAQHGISGTTMKTVTGIAGLSMGIVNFHFQSKDTLFRETLRFLAEEHREKWSTDIQSAPPRPEDKLLAMARAHFHPSICNRKKLTVWYGFYGEAANRAAYREIMTDIDDERWKTSIELCDQIIREGGYENITAQHVSDTLEGLYDGLCLNILIYPNEFTPEHAKQRVEEVLVAFFPKHFKRPSP